MNPFYWRVYNYITPIAVITAIIGTAWLVSSANASPANRVPPLADPCAYREVTDNRFMVEIYDDNGVVRYRASDLELQSVTESRDATAQEIAIYAKQCSPVDAALTDLKGNVEGSNAATWVNNRIAELSACELDMVKGQGIDFAALGNAGQNQVIHRMQECIELESRTLRIQIDRLYKLLVAQGIIAGE